MDTWTGQCSSIPPPRYVTTNPLAVDLHVPTFRSDLALYQATFSTGSVLLFEVGLAGLDIPE